MTKYILTLLPFLCGFYNYSHATPEDAKILLAAIKRVKASTQPIQVNNPAPAQLAQEAKQQVVQAQQKQPEPKPQPAPKAAPAQKPTLQPIVQHLDHYVDCAFNCIKRFLNPKNKNKLAVFAKEIEQCVKELDNQVIKPLESMQNNPVAKQLYNIAIVLKQNQVQFKNTISGNYKNSISLGMALSKLESKAIKQVNTELKRCMPCINASSIKAQFAPIKQKIVALTNYNVGMAKALSALRKRF